MTHHYELYLVFLYISFFDLFLAVNSVSIEVVAGFVFSADSEYDVIMTHIEQL